MPKPKKDFRLVALRELDDFLPLEREPDVDFPVRAVLDDFERDALEEVLAREEADLEEVDFFDADARLLVLRAEDFFLDDVAIGNTFLVVCMRLRESNTKKGFFVPNAAFWLEKAFGTYRIHMWNIILRKNFLLF